MPTLIAQRADTRPVGLGIPAPQPRLPARLPGLHRHLARTRSRLRRAAPSRFPPLEACPPPPAPAHLPGPPPPPPEHRPMDDAYRLDIAFDLSLPLPPQLEAARFRLV